MALYDDPKKKKPVSALAAPNTAAPALGALPAVASWALNRPEPQGFNPVMPDYAAPNPTNKPIMLANVPKPAVGTSATQARAASGGVTPAVARPDFSNVRGGSQTTYGSTQSSASTPTGAGASSAAGGAAPKPDDVNTYTNGAGVTKRVPMPGTMGTVNTQNFGNPVVPQAPGSIARPGVASTFGLGVNDPRLQAPSIQRPGQLTLNSNGNAETFNARQDREASKALASDLGTEAFMLRGKTDAASLRAMGDIAQTRAGLLSGTEGLSAAAIQGTANRGNTLANTGMEQSGANLRQQMQGDVALSGQQVDREGNLLSADVERAKIARPEYITDAKNNYLSVTNGQASAVTDASGAPIQMPGQAATQQRDYQAEAFNNLVADLMEGQRDAMGALPANAVENAITQAQKVQAARQQQGGQAQVTPTLAAYLKAARDAGFKETDAEIAAAFKKKYPQAQ